MILYSPLSLYKRILTAERWEYIKDSIEHWIPAKNENGDEYKNMLVNPETQTVCFSTNGEILDSWKRNVFEKLLNDEERKQVEEFSLSHLDELRFEKANKIPKGEYSGPVTDGNSFYDDVENYIEVNGDDREYVWAVKQYKALNENDIEEFLEILEERNSFEDEFPEFPLTEELKSVWMDYVEKHNMNMWKQDMTTVVML